MLPLPSLPHCPRTLPNPAERLRQEDENPQQLVRLSEEWLLSASLITDTLPNLHTVHMHKLEKRNNNIKLNTKQEKEIERYAHTAHKLTVFWLA